MKGLKKILLSGLPIPLADALEEQLAQEAFSVVRADDGDIFDLAVSPEETAVPMGCPVLRLDIGRPVRLGLALRLMGQALAEPTLHMDDMAFDAWIFSPREKLLTRKEGERGITLTDREADMLAYLARHRGQPVSRDDLLKNVWQYQDGVDTHTLETHIYRLRQKMNLAADEQGPLVTAAGGYRLCMEEKA